MDNQWQNPVANGGWIPRDWFLDVLVWLKLFWLLAQIFTIGKKYSKYSNNY